MLRPLEGADEGSLGLRLDGMKAMDSGAVPGSLPAWQSGLKKGNPRGRHSLLGRDRDTDEGREGAGTKPHARAFPERREQKYIVKHYNPRGSDTHSCR